MSPSSPQVAQLYAIRLLPVGAQARTCIVGRLEHVLSGRIHEFHSGAGLLAFLTLEQSRLEASQARGGAAEPFPI